AFGRAPANAPAWLQWMPRYSASDVQSLDLAFRQRVESVQSVDRMIEELERELIKTGELRNTYFVFSSDNGLHLGEHRMLAGKTTAFDTDIKVPVIVAGPGVPAGSTVSAMASSIDLAPTFLQIAGARPTDRPDGVSLLSLLHGARRPPNWQSAILVEHHGPAFTPSDPDQQPSRSGNPPSYEAVRTADFLYVEYATGDREYYDLRHDPQEMNNIESKLTAARLMSLHQMLTALEACHGASACQAAAAASA
ncbi:MAG TPA: sulfatase-like hydrolase/transferase, partial [Jatrophihabitans sp.]|nr:sulfatase-like hydrolase/transferase [Jatrophihabitans sp.]